MKECSQEMQECSQEVQDPKIKGCFSGIDSYETDDFVEMPREIKTSAEFITWIRSLQQIEIKGKIL